MKNVRAAAVIAVVMTAAGRARAYAREHPAQVAKTLDTVEELVRTKADRKHAAQIDRGSAALRQGLGLPPRPSAGAAAMGAARLTDPDPDTTEPPASHGFRDPVAPNPSPGTSDDPQPRRHDEDPAPLTPGERPHR